MILIIVVSQQGDPNKYIINMDVGRGTTADVVKKKLYKGIPEHVRLTYTDDGEEVEGWVTKTKLHAIVKEKNKISLENRQIFVDTIEREPIYSSGEDSEFGEDDLSSSDDMLWSPQVENLRL